MLDNNNTNVEEITKNGPSEKKTKKTNKNKKKNIPTDLKVWKADPRFGTRDSVQIDSFSHNFQNSNFTEGIHGQYNSLGNLGSPRLSRLFVNRPEDFSYFIFADPYDFFIKPFSSLHFTNTKAPITNITYHKTQNSDNGEDRINAIYAINMNKDIGFGLKLDYLYGRGYYEYQNTSDFNATFFGSILKDQYKAHFFIYSNYLKTAENGGITDDNYVTNPENFPSKFGTNDIPTNLDKVWNKIHYDGLQWTHSYSVGFRKLVEIDSTNQLKKDSIPQAKPPHKDTKGDLTELSELDLDLDSQKTDSTKLVPKTIFVPVTSFIHTLKVQSNSRLFLANQDLSSFYTNRYYAGDSTSDKINNTLVSNLFAIELHEGFNKWAMAGIRLFAQHDFNNYKMPSARRLNESFVENRFTVGGQILKRTGKNINYTLEGQTSSEGGSWGDFKLSGEGLLKVNIFGDSVSLKVHGAIINRKPTFFYRKYHSQYLWWDNDLNKQFTTHFGAVLDSKKTNTRISFDVQNIKHYTYLANTATQVTDTTTYTNNTSVLQSSSDIQTLSFILNQNFRLGILNWENEVAYQTTSNKNVLPLPDLSLYSNLYLLFRIAHVLRVEFGGDVHFFTSYYAPTYSPAIGQFVTQSENNRVKIGNYPVVDIYANLHLKHTRFYVMASHVNYSKSSNGSKFYAPHYPIVPFTIRLGISWNFFN